MDTIRKRFMGMLTMLIVGGLALGGCDDSSSPDEGSLSLLLTDAPGAGIEHAWVEITGIYLQGEAPDDQGRLWLLEESTGLIDLTTLADATLELVKDVVVTPGTYSQLRVIIGEAVIETDDGKVYTKPGSGHPEGEQPDGFLECPSCTENGIKVNLPGGAVTIEDDAKILVLDFDVTQSFGREAGLSSVWVMNPLINGSDFEASGTISGTVSLAEGLSLPVCGGDAEASLSDFVPMASSADVEKSGNVDAEGTYKISFVEPGDWDLSYAAEVTFDNGETLSFSADHPATVSVGSGAVASADFTVTEAGCM